MNERSRGVSHVLSSEPQLPHKAEGDSPISVAIEYNGSYADVLEWNIQGIQAWAEVTGMRKHIRIGSSANRDPITVERKGEVLTMKKLSIWG